MITKNIEINTADGVCDAYIAYPSDAGTFPPVLLYMDAFGLRPCLEDLAKTLANSGYFVLFPNLFYRIKKAPIPDLKFPLKKEDMGHALPIIIPLARGHDPELTLKDCESFFKFFREQKNVGSEKFGVTGYCMGGSLALRTAARFPTLVAAAASFHGGSLATEAPNSPHRGVPLIKARVYIAHADQDASMPIDQIAKLQKTFETSHVRYEIETYQGAEHGFVMEDLPAFNESARARHWTKLIELLKGSH